MAGTLVIDPTGRVVHYDEAEAQRAHISRWQAIGRDFYRDLAWTLGRDAAERIRRFQAQGAAADRFTTSTDARTGRQELEVRLAQVAGNVEVTVSGAPGSRARA